MDFNQEFKNVDLGNEIKNGVKKDSDFYDAARENAMQEYLADVGPISQYINQQMDQISKEKNSSMEK